MPHTVAGLGPETIGGIMLAFVTLAQIDAVRALPPTGKPWIDNDPRLRVYAYVLGRSMGVDPRIILAILRNEVDPHKTFLGDVDAGGGPSVGPMQVYRRTAKDLKLWTPSVPDFEREEYAALAQEVFMTMRWGVAVYKDKLARVGGVIRNALGAYNGSGPNGDYANRACEWLNSVGVPC